MVRRFAFCCMFDGVASQDDADRPGPQRGVGVGTCARRAQRARARAKRARAPRVDALAVPSGLAKFCKISRMRVSGRTARASRAASFCARGVGSGGTRRAGIESLFDAFTWNGSEA